MNISFSNFEDQKVRKYSSNSPLHKVYNQSENKQIGVHIKQKVLNLHLENQQFPLWKTNNSPPLERGEGGI